MAVEDFEWTDVGADSGELYEALLVPPLFAPWAPILLHAGHVAPGDRVIDVACGTGVVARTALELVGDSGSVTGVDLSESMLRVARRRAPDVAWHAADVRDLLFADGDFDVALSQAGLMFVPEPERAMAELHRVLRLGGRLAVQVWAASRANAAFADVVERHFGVEPADRFRLPWSFTDPARLQAVAARGGFTNATVTVETGMSTFDSIEAYVAAQTAVLLAGHDTTSLVDDTREALAEHVQADGSVRIPAPGNIVTAVKT